MIVELTTPRVLVISTFALWLGAVLNKRIPLLGRLSIPAPVTGGIPVAILLTAVGATFGAEFQWDLALRDALLLVFFSAVGLSAKLSRLKQGGSLFFKLALLVIVFLFLQNLIGVGVAIALGRNPAYGLIAGSIAFSGGHGTAITWGLIAQKMGYEIALPHGLAFATLGLIAGATFGGPLASWLVKRHGLAEPVNLDGLRGVEPETPEESGAPITSRSILLTILLLSLSAATGAEINGLVSEAGLVLPGFVTAMLAGVLLTNLVDVAGLPLYENAIHLIQDVSLSLFLAMTLVALDLAQLATAIVPLGLGVTAQVCLAAAFAAFVVFRVCGKDYDAAVLSAGFVGIGLGATPVGMANMEAVTKRFGPSPRALLVLPLIGAGVLDLANAAAIETFVRLLL